MRDRRRIDKTRDRNSTNILLFSIVTAVIIGILLQNFPYLAFPGSRDTLMLLGTGIIWCGVIFRIWAIRVLGPFFTAVVTVQRNQRIISEGPYRYIRHPFYTGSLLAFLGLGIAFGNLIGCLLIRIIVFLGVHQRMNVEEEVLRASFGAEYENYMKKTKRIFPFIY
jgi:protein-S-isoprenylcysteine O-methyltransferase Ste14